MAAVNGNNADNFLVGSEHDDAIFANGGNDFVIGASGNDAIFGGLGADKLFGGNGNDLLSGSDALPADSDGAVDSLVGGNGADRYFIFDGQDVVIEEVDGGIDTDQFESFSYKAENNVENLQFERDAVQGIGNELNNRMTMTKADDDTDKLMDGRGGNDILTGGNGVDALIGGNGLDSLRGGNEGDRLFGGADNDFLRGDDGDDRLDGGDANDRLFGGNGIDTLVGGAGDDSLIGSVGGDFLSGGAGNDIFVYQNNADESRGSIAETRDTITDFVHGQDKISVAGVDANAGQSGTQDFVFIGSAGFTAPGQVRAVQAADGTLILASNDFDGTAEIAIRLDDKMNLSAGDFIF